MKSRRNRFSGQFSGRLIEMMESAAWRALSLAGRRVIDRVEIEHGHHGGTDNGKLPVTFDQFCEYGLHRHSIAPGVRETVALGFLEVTQRGRAGNAEHRAPNLFRLTYRLSEGVQGDGSHEWRRIKSTEEAEEIAAAARKAKSKKKTKNQCRKMPAFGDKNRHRNPDFPVPKTGTKEMAKTGTTSISRDIPPEQSAGEARHSQGAVASRPMATNPPPLAVSERADILLSRVACRLGSGEVGWLIAQAATEPELDNLVALEARGELDAATLAATRLKYRRGAA
jgi:hypothetical protein